MNDVHENGSHPETTPTEAHFREAPLDEALLAYLFGDELCDPDPLFSRFTGDSAALAWLDAFERDYSRIRGEAHSPALDRARALRDELKRRAEAPIDWDSARALSNVRSLDAARHAGHAAARSQTAERARRPSKLGARLAIGGVLAATLAAAALLLLSVRSAPREVGADMAMALTAPIMDQAGHGFAGPPAPSARDRGFLLGAVIDLSRPRKATGVVAETELELARTLADRALDGLDGAPDSPEERRLRLLGGCGAILSASEDRKACEAGLEDYQRRRDTY